MRLSGAIINSTLFHSILFISRCDRIRFYIARLISDVMTPEYRILISLSRYATELSPGILASIRGTSDRASLPAAYSQSRQNVGRVISISAICSRIRVRTSIHTRMCVCVCISGWHKRTGRCAVSSAFAWSARKEFVQFRLPGDAADQSAEVACMHAIYMCTHTYTWACVSLAMYEVCQCNIRLATPRRPAKKYPPRPGRSDGATAAN